MIKYKLLADFKIPGAEKMWEIVGGEIAGGESGSRLIVASNGTAVFEGTMSPKDGGGFSSVQTHIGDLLLDSFRGVALRIKGDGNHYHLRLGMEGDPEGLSYEAAFATQPDAWITIHIPFNKFRPSSNGNIAFFEPSSIRRVGIATADKQPGSFRLEIEWIKAYLDY